MATKAQAQQAVSESTGFGLSDQYKVVTHSRGTTWVVESPEGLQLLVTLTEGGKNVMAVTSKKAPAKKAEVEEFLTGSIKIGRNTFEARKSLRDGQVYRLTREGTWATFTGTAKFQLG